MQARGPSVASVAVLGLVTLAVLGGIIAGIVVGVSQRGQLDPLPNGGTLADTIAGRGDLQTLSQALAIADLTDALATGGPFTVFAPRDSAFEALPPEVAQRLDEDPAALQELLLYHVLDGALLADEIPDGEIPTLQGEDVIADNGSVNGVELAQTDIAASNGVIHTLDMVLIPPSFLDAGADDLQVVLVDELRALETELESRGAALDSFATRASAPRLAWRAFARNQAAAAGATVELRQADFDSGTLRVLAPCTLVLVEDIEFRPNSDADFRPTDAQRGSGEYPRASGFELDFFAAIMIGTDDVLLDLNGHELKSSREWHTKQSFGMLISIATTPFISGEGPAAFGNDHYAPNRVVIRNGRLGFNQHHAIHGNAGRGIYLHDLEIELFHIAGIALNGVEDVVIERVTIANTNTDLAVTGAFSQARFLQRFLARAAPLHAPSAAALARLEQLEREAFDDVVAANHIDAAAHPDAHRLFDNAARMVDGNAYGLVITNRGTGAPQFDAEYSAGGASYRVLVRDVAISNIRNSIVETVVLLDERDKAIVGPAGDVLMFDKTLSAGAVDELLDAQLAFAAAFRQFGAASWHAGTLNVPDALVDWYEAGAVVGELGALIAANEWRWARNTE